MADIAIHNLMHWLDQCPTPFHVVERAGTVLSGAGFVATTSLSDDLPTKGYLSLDGAVVAWHLGQPSGSLRIIGAHTDSPNLRVRPNPDLITAGWSQLGVEIYGGVLLNSWLDRDLGVAGRVVDAAGDSHLFSVASPVARIPQLAIHLDREISERGLVLDRQQHMNPVWGLNAPSFKEWLLSVTGVHAVAYDAHLFDVTPAQLVGNKQEFLASARLDNQVSCWAAVEALATSQSSDNSYIIVLNDHEEVGSESSRGAAGPLLSNIVSRIADQHSLSGGARFDRAEQSWCLSADNAHAIHPNYTERHEPLHAPLPNAGPALKLNGNQRYATSARGATHLTTVANEANVPLQTFVSRNNMPCGSTIGPITATTLGIEAIDIGVPQLSMHSAREMCGSEDPVMLVKLMQNFLAN